MLRPHGDQDPFDPGQAHDALYRMFDSVESSFFSVVSLEVEPLEVAEPVVDDRRDLSLPVMALASRSRRDMGWRQAGGRRLDLAGVAAKSSNSALDVLDVAFEHRAPAVERRILLHSPFEVGARVLFRSQKLRLIADGYLYPECARDVPPVNPAPLGCGARGRRRHIDARLSIVGPARHHSADLNVKLLSDHDGLWKIDGEEPREIRRRSERNGNIGHALGCPHADRMRISGAEAMSRIALRGELQDVLGVDLRPINARKAARGHGAPIYHQFVGIVLQRALRYGRLARPRVESLRDAMRLGKSGISRRRDLEVALGELVAVLRAQRHAAAVGDRRLIVGDLRQ